MAVTRDAIQYTTASVGPSPQLVPVGTAQAYANVGVGGSVPTGEAFAYLYFSDLVPTPPVPAIWRIVPTIGPIGSAVRIIGFGFGMTPEEYSGTIELGDEGVWVSVTPVSWIVPASTPDTYTDQRVLDASTGEFDMDHTEVIIAIPSWAVPPGYAVRVRTGEE